MNHYAVIDLDWVEGPQRFCLKFGQLVELEDRRGVGCAAILARLTVGQWFVSEVADIIRLGLVGGGMEPTPAARLVQRYVKERPLAESVPIARAILMAAIVSVGEVSAPPGGAAEVTDGSTSPPTTEPGP